MQEIEYQQDTIEPTRIIVKLTEQLETVTNLNKQVSVELPDLLQPPNKMESVYVSKK